MEQLHLQPQTRQSRDRVTTQPATEAEKTQADAQRVLSPQDFYEEVTERPDMRDLLTRLAH